MPALTPVAAKATVTVPEVTGEIVNPLELVVAPPSMPGAIDDMLLPEAVIFTVPPKETGDPVTVTPVPPVTVMVEF